MNMKFIEYVEGEKRMQFLLGDSAIGLSFGSGAATNKHM